MKASTKQLQFLSDLKERLSPVSTILYNKVFGKDNCDNLTKEEASDRIDVLTGALGGQSALMSRVFGQYTAERIKAADTLRRWSWVLTKSDADIEAEAENLTTSIEDVPWLGIEGRDFTAEEMTEMRRSYIKFQKEQRDEGLSQLAAIGICADTASGKETASIPLL